MVLAHTRSRDVLLNNHNLLLMKRMKNKSSLLFFLWIMSGEVTVRRFFWNHCQSKSETCWGTVVPEINFTPISSLIWLTWQILWMNLSIWQLNAFSSFPLFILHTLYTHSADSTYSALREDCNGRLSRPYFSHFIKNIHFSNEYFNAEPVPFV